MSTVKSDRLLQGIFIVLMTIDIEGKKIKVKGMVAHSRSDTASGRYLSGIKFSGPEDDQRLAIIAFVKTYHHRKRLGARSESAA